MEVFKECKSPQPLRINRCAFCQCQTSERLITSGETSTVKSLLNEVELEKVCYDKCNARYERR